MLARLYEPIIWRALNVTHPVVRRNAVTLLTDAFPLQDPQAPVDDTNHLIQKQFDCLSVKTKLSRPSTIHRFLFQEFT